MSSVPVHVLSTLGFCREFGVVSPLMFDIRYLNRALGSAEQMDLIQNGSELVLYATGEQTAGIGSHIKYDTCAVSCQRR